MICMKENAVNNVESLHTLIPWSTGPTMREWIQEGGSSAAQCTTKYAQHSVGYKVNAYFKFL